MNLRDPIQTMIVHQNKARSKRALSPTSSEYTAVASEPSANEDVKRFKQVQDCFNIAVNQMCVPTWPTTNAAQSNLT